MLKRTKTTLATLAAIPLALALLTGCSAASPAAESAKSDVPAATTYTDLGEWTLAYAQCMRSEGVDMPDPGPDGSMTSTVTVDGDAYSAASKKCLGKLGQAPTAPGEKQQSKQEMLAEQLKVAQCFRDNGIAMDDPAEGHISGIPADAPQAVIEKCTGRALPQGTSQLGTTQ